MIAVAAIARRRSFNCGSIKENRVCRDLAHIKTKSTRAGDRIYFCTSAATNVHHQQQKETCSWLQTQFLGAGTGEKINGKATLPCSGDWSITRLDSVGEKVDLSVIRR
jgi:hypothetical protein